MKTHSAKKELALLPLLLVAIALCVGGHFLLQGVFQQSHLVEYLLAALPFVLFGTVLIAIKMALKAEKVESAEDSEENTGQ